MKPFLHFLLFWIPLAGFILWLLWKSKFSEFFTLTHPGSGFEKLLKQSGSLLFAIWYPILVFGIWYALSALVDSDFSIGSILANFDKNEFLAIALCLLLPLGYATNEMYEYLKPKNTKHHKNKPEDDRVW